MKSENKQNIPEETRSISPLRESSGASSGFSDDTQFLATCKIKLTISGKIIQHWVQNWNKVWRNSRYN